jgi:hypothetical protein
MNILGLRPGELKERLGSDVQFDARREHLFYPWASDESEQWASSARKIPTAVLSQGYTHRRKAGGAFSTRDGNDRRARQCMSLVQMMKNQQNPRDGKTSQQKKIWVTNKSATQFEEDS